jgi:hypothetical protein
MDALLEAHPDWKLLSKSKLYAAARRADAGISRKAFDEWYASNAPATNELFAEPRTTKRNQARIVAPPRSFQMDVVHFDRYKSANNKLYRFLLLVEINSRKAFAYVLKDEKMDTIVAAYKRFLRDAGHEPFVVEGDDAFRAQAFRRFNDSKGIPVVTVVAKDEHVTSGNPLSIIDRTVRTLRRLVEKCVTADGDPKWTGWLPDIIKLYNATPHDGLRRAGRKTGSPLSPDDVYEDTDDLNRRFAQAAQHNRELATAVQTKFKPDDYVRVRLSKGTFEKGSTQTMSNEVYRVAAVKGTRVTLKTFPAGEPVDRAYKPNELAKVDRPRNVQPAAAPAQARKAARTSRRLARAGLDEAAEAAVEPEAKRAKRAAKELPRLRSEVPRKLDGNEWVVDAVLKRRTRKGEREALVRWEDTWETKARKDRFADEVDAVLKEKGKGRAKRFLVRWKTTWVPEASLS